VCTFTYVKTSDLLKQHRKYDLFTVNMMKLLHKLLVAAIRRILPSLSQPTPTTDGLAFFCNGFSPPPPTDRVIYCMTLSTYDFDWYHTPYSSKPANLLISFERLHRVPIVLKSGSLNLQEPSGPVQACNEIALLIHLHLSNESPAK
jgi:hypothetical protein